MKISIPLLFLTANAERKVPPRTPKQRLNTLQRFAVEWFNTNIHNRPRRVQNLTERVLPRFINRLKTTARKPCFYFNRNVPNGGPRPDGAPKDEPIESNFDFNNNRQKRSIVDHDDSFFDRYFAAQAQHTLASPGGGERTLGDVRVFALEERLSFDIDLAWHQIGTGFVKWIDRYIAECPSHSKHLARLEKFHGKVKKAFESGSANQ